jgi:hypothetical protein
MRVPDAASGPTRGEVVIHSARRQEDVMRRFLFLILGGLVAMGFAAGPAFASSPHFKPGGTPTCTITFTGASSASTTCTGTMAGLGNEDVGLSLTTNGTAVYQCQNGGGNTAPGQNKVLVGPATSNTIIPANQIKNGNLTFTTGAAVLTAPSTVTAQQAGCPNNNWTGVNPVLTVTSIMLSIQQPPGTEIFNCTASDAWTSNTTVTLSCTAG